MSFSNNNTEKLLSSTSTHRWGRSVAPPTEGRWCSSRRRRRRRKKRRGRKITTTITITNDGSNSELSANTVLSFREHSTSTWQVSVGLNRLGYLKGSSFADRSTRLDSARLGSVRLRWMNLQLRGQTTAVMAAALASVYITDVIASYCPDWLSSQRCCFHGCGVKQPQSEQLEGRTGGGRGGGEGGAGGVRYF